MYAMIISTDPANKVLPATAAVGPNSAWRWGVPLFSIISLFVLLVLGNNVSLFYSLNHLMSYASDGLWIHLSLLGDGQLVILFLLPFLGRRPDIVWQFILAAIIAGLAVYGLKELFSAARPPASLLERSFHLIGPALQNNSFPSGHTTTAFVLAGLLCMQRVNALIKTTVLIIAVFVGLSRIANGVHWPQDVLGGALIGWAVAILAVWLAQLWRAGLNIRFQRVSALLVTVLSIWAVWSLWNSYNQVYPGTDLMKALLLFICFSISVPGQLRLFNLKR
jgi:membrane-associated phospholipid phosphatase